MADDAQSVEDVKRALLRDIDAGKVREDGGYVPFLDLGPGGRADVAPAAWRLHADGLAKPGLSADEEGLSTWRLTDAGRAYLEAGTDG